MYTNDSCSHDCFHCDESFDQKEDPFLRCRVKGGLPVAHVRLICIVLPVRRI